MSRRPHPSPTQWKPTPWQFIVASASFFILSYPPFDLGWLAWGALIPWLIALERLEPGEAFLRSYCLGVLFFGGTIWWIGYVTLPGFILLVAYLALFFGVWGWFANRLLSRGELPFLLGLPAAWSLLEYLRSILLTGLGWNLLAHTQWNWIPIIQIADLTGVTGVSFLVVLVNAALYRALRFPRKSRRALGPVLVAGSCLLGAFLYGEFFSPVPSLENKFRVAVVQGNIPQAEKWDEAHVEAIWKRYEALTHEAAKEKPDLIIWPETSVPDYLVEAAVTDAQERLRELVYRDKTFLLVGAPMLSEDQSRVFNSAVLLDPEGQIFERYDKVHLVPFGEYLPLERFLGWLRKLVYLGDFSRGQRYTVFQSPAAAPFSVLICFEDLFPGLTRRFVREGAQWLVVVTNDAWFERSAASVQHLQASVFRAVENRVWVVRAANTGWSGFIDMRGRRLAYQPEFAPAQRVPLFHSGFAVAEPYVMPDPNGRTGNTVYSRWGDWFQILCLGLVGLAFFPTRKPV